MPIWQLRSAGEAEAWQAPVKPLWVRCTRSADRWSEERQSWQHDCFPLLVQQVRGQCTPHSHGCLQVSDKCVQLVQDGWFNPSAEPSGVSVMTNPKVQCLPKSSVLDCDRPAVGRRGAGSSSALTQCSSSIHTFRALLRCACASIHMLVIQEPKQKLPVIVAGKDVKEVDNDYFLIPIKILDHEGPLQTDFAIENRLTPQGEAGCRLGW